jgi:hypothetical protein
VARPSVVADDESESGLRADSGVVGSTDSLHAPSTRENARTDVGTLCNNRIGLPGKRRTNWEPANAAHTEFV